jgi:hypothetical protein
VVVRASTRHCLSRRSCTTLLRFLVINEMIYLILFSLGTNKRTQFYGTVCVSSLQSEV